MSLRILLVDDNPDDRALVKYELQQHFPDVMFAEARGLEEFSQLLEQQVFDVVITDYQLRWHNGLEVLKQVKAQFPDIPVIMFTATGTQEIAVEAMKSGLDDYIVKSPKHLVRLRTSVAQVLGRAQDRHAIRAAEMRYQTLFNDVPIGLMRGTLEGEIVDVNPTLMTLLQYPNREELLQVSLKALFADMGDWEAMQSGLQAQNTLLNFETTFLRYDGTTAAVEINARTSDLGFFEASIDDISARKQVETERAELLRLAEEARAKSEVANNVKMRFLGMISHELRTPLTAIKGFSSTLLADDVTWTAEQQRQFVQIIDEEANKLHDLVNQLLDMTQLQGGQIRIFPMQESLTDVIQQVIGDLKKTADDHPLQLEIPETLPQAIIDAKRIQQVLMSLVENAARFSPPKTPITIIITKLTREIQVDVCDEGSGIAAEDRAYVFDPFRQVHQQYISREGVGLGLTISKGVIEAHGGRMWLQNPPVGTTISFTLPTIP